MTVSSEVIVDIVCIVWWVLTVWVCVYDWEDAREIDRRREKRLEKRRMMARMWQRDGRQAENEDNGNKFPTFSDGTDSHDRSEKL